MSVNGVIERDTNYYQNNADRITVKDVAIELVRFIMSIGCIVAVSAIIMGAGALYQDHQRIMNQKVQTVPEPSKEEIRAAHKYHGVLWSWQDGEECYFKDKKGRVCKLFGYKENK
jgi:hypothetical protein